MRRHTSVILAGLRRLALGSLLVCAGGLGAVAFAAPADAPAGDDLHAWRSLEAQRLSGDGAEAAYRDFLVQWADSPLALMACERLHALGADPLYGLRGRRVRARVQLVKRQHEAQRRRLLSALDAAASEVADAAEALGAAEADDAR